MDNKIVEIKCDKNLELLLPYLKQNIEQVESSNESYDESSDQSSDNSDDSLEFETCDNDEINKESLVTLLNIMGQVYYADKEFNYEEISVKFTEDMDKMLIESLIYEANEGDYYVNKSDDNYHDIDPNFWIEKSEYKLSYDKIIIKYNKYHNIVCEHNHKWIKIDDENSEIILCKNNSKLKINDILYVTKIIAITYGRKFLVQIDDHKFEILNDNNNILTLKY